MSEASFRVKGSSIRSKLVFVAETFGDDAEAELRQLLEHKGTWPVLEATWYPFEIYNEILVWLAKRFYGGDLRRLVDIGRFSAQKALTTTYDAFRSSGDFSRFLEKLPVLHSRYYSHGKLSASLVLPGARSCRLILEGAPTYTAADVTVAAGFFMGCAEMMGLEGVSATFRRGPRRVVFDLQWQG